MDFDAQEEGFTVYSKALVVGPVAPAAPAAAPAPTPAATAPVAATANAGEEKEEPKKGEVN